MKLLAEGKSRGLSCLALGAGGLCGFLALRSALELFLFLQVYSAPIFLLSLAHSTVPVDIPPLAGFLVDHMLLAFVFSFLFWLAGAILAFGVWGRREWARRGAAAMLYLAGAAALLLLLYPWLAIPRPLVYGGISLAPEFNSAVKAAAFLTRLGALLACGLCAWWALALDRSGLKKEFGTGGPPARLPSTPGENR